MLGLLLLYGALITCTPWLESRLGLLLPIGPPSAYEVALIMLVAAAGLLVGLIPAYRIYRFTVADGMTIRI
jgi:putative ABC transport system permease protein